MKLHHLTGWLVLWLGFSCWVIFHALVVCWHFSKIYIFMLHLKKNQEHCQSVKWFGFLSRPTFFRSWSGSELLANDSQQTTKVTASKQRVNVAFNNCWTGRKSERGMTFKSKWSHFAVIRVCALVRSNTVYQERMDFKNKELWSFIFCIFIA